MDLLVESAVRITVLCIGVALVLRALRIRSPRVVHRAWTALVFVMLLLPLSVASGLKLAVPVLPSPATPALLAPVSEAVAPTPSNGVRMITAAAADGPHAEMMWRAVAVTVYAAGVGLLLVRLAIGMRRARVIRRDARLINGRLTHPSCVTPMSVGILAPVVILPSDWATLSEAELSAIVAHEEEHARRRDPLVACIALLNRAIFWFHPLAWWLQRTIAGLSEQACDAVVMARGHDADVYSACLLRFARRAAYARGRIAPMATAIAGAGLRERVDKLTKPLPGTTIPRTTRMHSGGVCGTPRGVRRSCTCRGACASHSARSRESGGVAHLHVGTLRDRSRPSFS